MNRLITFTALLAVVLIRVSRADCPLDHLKIGCNPDGVWGTPDDNRLFVDCAQKYRHSDPSSPSDPAWLHWHYPMYYNVRYNRYEIGEPGFDLLCEDEDPNRALVGTPNVDFRIVIECVSIRSGFSARNATLGILLIEQFAAIPSITANCSIPTCTWNIALPPPTAPKNSIGSPSVSAMIWGAINPPGNSPWSSYAILSTATLSSTAQSIPSICSNLHRIG